MAYPEHVKILRQGVEAWNEWREENPAVGPDLREADLGKADLREAFLGEAVLEGANLREAVLEGANLRGAVLEGADLEGADLLGADLEGAKLWGAVLEGADLEGAKLWGAVLRGADLGKANLRGAVLRGANLREAVLEGADLTGADLREAKLWGAYVRSIYSGLGTNHGSRPEYIITDLSSIRNLEQWQLNVMLGDWLTKIPKGMAHPWKKIPPEYWPEGSPGPFDKGAENPDAEVETEAQTDQASDDDVQAASSTTASITSRFANRSQADLRKSLLRDYPCARAMAQYASGEIAKQAALHKLVPTPNTDEELAQHVAFQTFLDEMQIIMQNVHEALPEEPEKLQDSAQMERIKQALIELGQKIDSAISTLDKHPGTYGSLWKLGVIGAATGVLSVLGIPVAGALAASSGVVGVNTFRLIVDRKP